MRVSKGAEFILVQVDSVSWFLRETEGLTMAEDVRDMNGNKTVVLTDGQSMVIVPGEYALTKAEIAEILKGE